ncbi:hypothetical protein C8R46DRAFT_1307762 [Mycena filopes]|nr:hypothetical protein C8R46DRAFT_1307762 [Mycena filopes]
MSVRRRYCSSKGQPGPLLRYHKGKPQRLGLRAGEGCRRPKSRSFLMNHAIPSDCRRHLVGYTVIRACPRPSHLRPAFDIHALLKSFKASYVSQLIIYGLPDPSLGQRNHSGQRVPQDDAPGSAFRGRPNGPIVETPSKGTSSMAGDDAPKDAEAGKENTTWDTLSAIIDAPVSSLRVQYVGLVCLSAISSAAPLIFIQFVLSALSDVLVAFKRSALGRSSLRRSCRIRTRLTPNARMRWADASFTWEMAGKIHAKSGPGKYSKWGGSGNTKAKEGEKGKEGEVLAVSEKGTPSTVTPAKKMKRFGPKNLRLGVPQDAFVVIGKVSSGKTHVGSTPKHPSGDDSTRPHESRQYPKGRFYLYGGSHTKDCRWILSGFLCDAIGRVASAVDLDGQAVVVESLAIGDCVAVDVRALNHRHLADTGPRPNHQGFIWRRLAAAVRIPPVFQGPALPVQVRGRVSEGRARELTARRSLWRAGSSDVACFSARAAAFFHPRGIGVNQRLPLECPGSRPSLVEVLARSTYEPLSLRQLADTDFCVPKVYLPLIPPVTTRHGRANPPSISGPRLVNGRAHGGCRAYNLPDRRSVWTAGGESLVFFSARAIAHRVPPEAEISGSTTPRQRPGIHMPLAEVLARSMDVLPIHRPTRCSLGLSEGCGVVVSWGLGGGRDVSAVDT